MKRRIRFLVLALVLSANMVLCACGGKTATETSQYEESEISDSEENGSSGGEKQSAEETKEDDKTADPDKRTGDAKLDSIIERIEEKGLKERESASSKMQAMVSEITDFDSYIDNKDRIKEGYDEMLCTLNDLYASLEEEFLQYCKAYKQDGAYQDYAEQSRVLTVIYNVLNYELSECYNTANNEFSGAYTVFNDIITDAYSSVDFDIASEEWSSMYEDYSEAWNEMYEDYSDAWSIFYAQYSAAYDIIYDDGKDIETVFKEAKEDYLQEKDLETETQKEEETKEDTPKEEKPKEDKPKEEKPKEDTKPEPEKEEEKDKETTNKGIRPEFQKAMDEYVEFFEEYCAFLKKYSETDDITSLYTDYLKYMQQYADTMEAFEKLGEEEMSDEEMKLYLKTMDEINKMLLSVY